MRAIEIDGVYYECRNKGAEKAKIDPNCLSAISWKMMKKGISVFEYNGHTINAKPTPRPVEKKTAEAFLAKANDTDPTSFSARLNAFLNKGRTPPLMGSSRAVNDLKDEVDEAREFLRDLNAITEEQGREIHRLSIRISELRNDFNSFRGIIKG